MSHKEDNNRGKIIDLGKWKAAHPNTTCSIAMQDNRQKIEFYYELGYAAGKSNPWQN